MSPSRYLILALLLTSAVAVQGGENHAPAAGLQQHYQAILRGEGKLLPETPISVSSSQPGDVITAEVVGVIPFPYETVAQLLINTQQWCDVLPLHFNVKACTREEDGALTLYSGRKFFQPPEAAYPLRYRVSQRHYDTSYAILELLAVSGPAGSRDYRLRLDAMPVAEGTVLRLQSGYRPSLLSRALTKGYLATLGRDKVGFTPDSSGITGIIERNAMRYFLAIQAHLSTRSLSPEMRYEAALRRWFNLTEAYPKQLHEMEEGEYLESKRHERQEQQQLQRKLAAS